MKLPPAGMTRGQLARRAGLNPETVRYYERIGLLPGVVRNARGLHVYPPECIERLALIAQARLLGISLSLIREMVGDTHSTALVEALESRAQAVEFVSARLTSQE